MVNPIELEYMEETLYGASICGHRKEIPISSTCMARAICNNDSIEFVIAGLEYEVDVLAERKLIELKQLFNKNNPGSSERCHWHIRKAPCLVTEKLVYEF